MPLPSEIRIRKAAEKDQPIIRAIIRRARIKPFDLDWPRFLLAETPGGEVVGCGQIKIHSDGSKELASIAVVKQWRHRGIASVIIRRLLNSHSDPIWLICQADLRSFYSQFGFVERRPSGDIPSYLRRAMRAARLFKRLIPRIGEIAVMSRDQE